MLLGSLPAAPGRDRDRRFPPIPTVPPGQHPGDAAIAYGRAWRFDGTMPELTRRRNPDSPDECWHVYYGECAWARSRSAPACHRARIHGPGLAASIPAAIRGNVQTAPLSPSTKPAPTSKQLGECSYRSGRKPIFKRGATSGIGRPRNIGASIGVSGCRLTGALVANRGWKRRFEDPIPLPRGRRLVTLRLSNDQARNRRRQDRRNRGRSFHEVPRLRAMVRHARPRPSPGTCFTTRRS